MLRKHRGLNPLCPVNDCTLFFQVASEVFSLLHFDPALIVLAIELVAHEDHESTVIRPAFGLPGAFR